MTAYAEFNASDGLPPLVVDKLNYNFSQMATGVNGRGGMSDISRLAAGVADVEAAAAAVDAAAAAAAQSASNAGYAASNALLSLSQVYDVVGTLNWMSQHAQYDVTQDSELDPEKAYYDKLDEDLYVIVAAQSLDERRLGITYRVSADQEQVAGKDYYDRIEAWSYEPVDEEDYDGSSPLYHKDQVYEVAESDVPGTVYYDREDSYELFDPNDGFDSETDYYIDAPPYIQTHDEEPVPGKAYYERSVEYTSIGQAEPDPDTTYWYLNDIGDWVAVPDPADFPYYEIQLYERDEVFTQVQDPEDLSNLYEDGPGGYMLDPNPTGLVPVYTLSTEYVELQAWQQGCYELVDVYTFDPVQDWGDGRDRYYRDDISTYTVHAGAWEAGLYEQVDPYYEMTLTDDIDKYLATHLALTDDGLNVMRDAESPRLLISNDQVQVIGPDGRIIASYGATVTIGDKSGFNAEFDSDSLTFFFGNQEMASFGNAGTVEEPDWRMFIDNAQATNSLIMGGDEDNPDRIWQWTVRDNGNLAAVYLGQ